MANIESQIKRNRQTVKRHARNQTVRTELKTRVKALLTAADAGDAEATETALRRAQKRIDTAAAKGVLHPNTANRKKSRLAKRANQSRA
jgi:small subunit ribosomal protein S20